MRGFKHRQDLLVLVSVLFLFGVVCEARRETRHVDLEPFDSVYIDGFGFLPEGIARFTFTFPSQVPHTHNAYLLGCYKRHLSQIWMQQEFGHFCTGSEKSREGDSGCFVHRFKANVVEEVSESQMDVKSVMEFYLFNCDTENATISANIEYSFVNPDQSQIGFQTYGCEYVAITMIILWLLYFAVWGLHLRHFEGFPQTLQRLVFMIGATQFLLAVLIAALWYYCRYNEDWPAHATMGLIVYVSLSFKLLIMLLFILSSGWKLGIPMIKWKDIISFTVICMGCFVSSILNYVIGSFFILILVVMFVVSTVFMHRCLVETLVRIRRRWHRKRLTFCDDSGRPLNRQGYLHRRKLLKNFSTFLVLFVTIKLFNYSIFRTLMETTLWTPLLIHLLANWSFICAISFLLSFRSHHRYHLRFLLGEAGGAPYI